MSDLTAANNARLAKALDRRYLGGSALGYNISELLAEGRIAYVRQDNNGKWGFVLSDKAPKAEGGVLPVNLYYVPYFDVAKIVAEHLMSEHSIPGFKALNNAGFRSVEAI